MLKRSNKQGEHLCFCNFYNMETAEKVSRKIQRHVMNSGPLSAVIDLMMCP